MLENLPYTHKNKLINQIQVGGDNIEQLAGYKSQQVAGNNCYQHAGTDSNQKAGNASKQINLGASHQHAGNNCIQIADYRSIQICGNNSVLVTGHFSKQVANNACVLSACEYSFSVVNGSDCIYKGQKGNELVMIPDEKVYKVGKDCQVNDVLFITNGEIQKIYTTTPDDLAMLEEHEIFVFSTDISGKHNRFVTVTDLSGRYYSKARILAVEKFGAIVGQASGIQGQSYAIPAVGEDMELLSEQQMKQYVDDFIAFACSHTRNIFYIADSRVLLYKDLFKHKPANIICPKYF